MKKFIGWTLLIVGVITYVTYALLEQSSTCDSLEQGVNRVVNESQFCTTDADCTSMSFNCPFGCLTAMSVEKKPDVMSAINEYRASCMPMCPDCPKGMVPVVRCESSRCSVSKR